MQALTTKRTPSTTAVALLVLVWLAWTAWARPLMLPDEGRYVGVAWEMLRSGDWLTPTLNGLPYFRWSSTSAKGLARFPRRACFTSAQQAWPCGSASLPLARPGSRGVTPPVCCAWLFWAQYWDQWRWLGACNAPAGPARL